MNDLELSVEIFEVTKDEYDAMMEAVTKLNVIAEMVNQSNEDGYINLKALKAVINA